LKPTAEISLIFMRFHCEYRATTLWHTWRRRSRRWNIRSHSRSKG